MNRVSVTDFGRTDDPFNLQVAVRGRSGADTELLVGQVKVSSTAISFTEYGDCTNPHLSAGPDDPQGDFTSVGDQNALEHESVSKSWNRQRSSCPLDVKSAGLHRRSVDSTGQTRVDPTELPTGGRTLAGESAGHSPSTRDQSGLDEEQQLSKLDRVAVLHADLGN